MAYSAEQWETIQNDFVQGIVKDGNLIYPSLTELSKIHKVTKSTMSVRAKKEQWENKREIFQNKIAKKHNQIIRTKIEQSEHETNKTNALSTQWAEFDLKCLEIANYALDLCKSDLEELQKYKDNYDDLPNEIKMRIRKYTPLELKLLAEAIEKYQKIGKNAVGETLANNDKPQQNITINTINDDNLFSRLNGGVSG